MEVRVTTTLLTGAAGFIGYQTALDLLAEGHHVVGVDNLNDYYDVRLKEYRFVEKTNSLPRCSTGSELRLRLHSFPQFRLILAWNPLRLNLDQVLAQFREPAFNFRVGFAR